MSRYVFCDVETTSLNPLRGAVWEMAYAVDDGPIQFSFVQHTLKNHDPMALAVGGYYTRYRQADRFEGTELEVSMLGALHDATLVAANPAFDAAFLQQRWDYWGHPPWKYRLLDLETYAMPALHLDEPKGLAYIAEQLGLPAPDHTAAGDVAVVRKAFYKLRDIYDERLS